MDMIGHNRENDQDIFQISPGKSAKSLQLARQAHLENIDLDYEAAFAAIALGTVARIGCFIFGDR